ncbi:ricin-type beta-trefoil lectin domain protein [uncultured Ferrimonas sp.]|uniref:ricin-type beta-trefoil lectin domain protein n=1 Tax=uncultured Ferrimonas sp. TaxID=432640 RepID=UPI002632DEDB|nr:ricin-type beta-trefoil lectin domain protein [uncultured Ferrimonas sp.]
MTITTKLLLPLCVFASISVSASELSQQHFPPRLVLTNGTDACLSSQSAQLKEDGRLLSRSCQQSQGESGMQQVFVASGNTLSNQQNNQLCLGVNAIAKGADLMFKHCDDSSPLQQLNWQHSGELRLGQYCLSQGRQSSAQPNRIELWHCDGGADQQWQAEEGAVLLAKLDYRTLPLTYQLHFDADYDGQQDSVPYWQTDVYAHNFFVKTLQVTKNFSDERRSAFATILPRLLKVWRTPAFRDMVLSNYKIINKGEVTPQSVWLKFRDNLKPVYVKGVASKGANGTANGSYFSLSTAIYSNIETNYQQHSKIARNMATITHEQSHNLGYDHGTNVPYGMSEYFAPLYVPANWDYPVYALGQQLGVTAQLQQLAMTVPDGSSTEPFVLAP